MKDVAISGRSVLFFSNNMAAVLWLFRRSMLLARGQVPAIGAGGAIIEQYLGEATKPRVEFERGPLKWVRAVQLENTLQIEGYYEHVEPLALPSLGFVVSDVLGSPIFGLNPTQSGIDRVDPPRSAGIVRAVITAPRLLDGTYRLSIWFGDGYHDFVKYKDCLTF